MEYDSIWANNNSDVHTMAKHYGLKSPQPIMCNSPEFDNCLPFSIWQQVLFLESIEGDIYEIVTSMDLVDIITEIAKRGLKSLKSVEVQ
jgi:hypothetical protein